MRESLTDSFSRPVALTSCLSVAVPIPLITDSRSISSSATGSSRLRAA